MASARVHLPGLAAAILACLGLSPSRARADAAEVFHQQLKASSDPMQRVMADGPAAIAELMAELEAAPFPAGILEALGFTRAPEVKGFLIGLLRDPRTLDRTRAGRIRAGALEALLKYEPDADIARAVAERLMQEDDWRDRQSLGEALVRLNHPASLPVLLEYLGKGRWENTEAVLRALARIGTPEALSRLRPLLDVREAYMPWYGELAEELARSGRREFAPLVIQAAEGAARGRSVDDRALRALGLFGDRRATPVLCQIVRKQTFRDQFWAAVALGELADPAALPELRAAFPEVKACPASPLWENQAALAYALARLGDKQGEQFLTTLSMSPEPEPAMMGLAFLLKLRGRAFVKPILDRLRPYRDIEDGCPGRWPIELIVDAWIDLDDAGVDASLVEAATWRQACRVAYHLRTRYDRRAPARWREALAAAARSGDLDLVNWAFQELLDRGGDPSAYLARMLREGSLPARILALRHLGLFSRERHRKALEAARRDPAWQVALEAAWQLDRPARGQPYPKEDAAPPAIDPGPRTGYAVVRSHRPFLEGGDPVQRAPVRRVARLADSRMAVATAEGLALYDGLIWRLRTVADGLCSDQAYDVAVRGARVWVAGEGGLAEGDGQRFACHRVVEGKVLRLALQGERVLLGTDRGLLAFQGGRVEALGGPTDPTVALLAAPDGDVWVASWPEVFDTAWAHSLRQAHERLHRLRRGRFEPVVEPLEHFFYRPSNLELITRAPVRVFDLALDGKGRLLVATDFGLLRREGERFTNLSGLGRHHPWQAVRALAVDGRGRIFTYIGSGLEILEGESWRRAPLLASPSDLNRSSNRDTISQLLLDGEGLWLAPGVTDQCAKVLPPRPLPTGADLESLDGLAALPLPTSGHCALVRWLDRDPVRRKLPPDTVVAALGGGGIYDRNADVDLSPPDQARRFRGGEAVRVPANVVTVSAVAKDPWDYGPVAYRFKFDEGEWSQWSDRNALITPNILDEGVHRVLVQARDQDGNVDPTPAELRFTVFTKELTIIKIHDGEFERIFPSQYLRYQRDGVGRVLLENLQDREVQVDLELRVEDLFERPARVSATLGPRSKAWVDVPAPFSDALLRNTSQRAAQAVLEARFTHEEVERSTRRAFGLELMEANAFAWDHPERLASFIHVRDPRVDRLSADVHRTFTARHPSEARAAHPLRNYLAALYAFEALRALGVRYKPDPARPFAGLKTGAVDTVLFPSQTLENRGGDCDDLVVLVAALLENLDVPTALLPVRGHIYGMFDSGVRVENRQSFPVEEGKTVVRDGRLWIPLETTVLGKGQGFEAAILAGAEAYFGKRRPEQAAILEVRAAWERNPPAMLAGVGAELPAPDLAPAALVADGVLQAYRQRIEQRAPRGQDREGLIARGEALARGGQFELSAQAFQQALAAREDDAALYGLGTAYAGQGDMLQALVSFQRALGLTQDRQQRFRCLLALAQCHKVNGNLTKARKHLEEALALNPAARFDGRYSALVHFVLDEEKTKAAGDDESAPFLQVLLLP